MTQIRTPVCVKIHLGTEEPYRLRYYEEDSPEHIVQAIDACLTQILETLQQPSVKHRCYEPLWNAFYYWLEERTAYATRHAQAITLSDSPEHASLAEAVARHHQIMELAADLVVATRKLRRARSKRAQLSWWSSPVRCFKASRAVARCERAYIKTHNALNALKALEASEAPDTLRVQTAA